MILQCMALALKLGPFADNVCLRPPTTMHELKLRVVDYIRMGEMKTLRTRFCVQYQPTDSKHARPAIKSDYKPHDPKPPNRPQYSPTGTHQQHDDHTKNT